jgi:hypothetical protein
VDPGDVKTVKLLLRGTRSGQCYFDREFSLSNEVSSRPGEWFTQSLGEFLGWVRRINIVPGYLLASVTNWGKAISCSIWRITRSAR